MTGSSGRLVLSLRQQIPASREVVFAALVEPSELKQWWGPAGFTTPEIELDLRVGGRYRFGMQPPEGDLFHLIGEFVEISEPSRLAYTFNWEEPDPEDQETIARLSLDDTAGATDLSLWQGEFATEERLALHHDGWTESLDRLRGLLGSRT